MAFPSENTRQRYDTERPTLPPIRDLFNELRTSHASPSMTLARLRVSEEYINPPGRVSTNSTPPTQMTSQHPREQSRPQTPLLYRHDPYYHNRHSLSLSPSAHRGREGRESLESLHDAHLHDPYRSNARFPPLHLPEPRGLPGYVTQEHPTQMQPTRSHVIPSHARDSKLARYPYAEAGLSRWPDERYTRTTAEVTDDEKTPIAGSSNSSVAIPSHLWKASDDNAATSSRYECNYCGKGFNRPSSLKIHLNSHTGAKPFVCPVESCGRSFSVLSNMRRHARVHGQTQQLHAEPLTSDDESERSFSARPSATSTRSHSRDAETSAPPHRRRSSTASVSSTSSRRSHASDEDRTSRGARPEKRSRRQPR